MSVFLASMKDLEPTVSRVRTDEPMKTQLSRRTHSSTPPPQSVNCSISVLVCASPTQCKLDTQRCTKLTLNFSSTFRQCLAAFPLCNRNNPMQRNNGAWMMFCRSPVAQCEALIVCCVIAHIHQNSLADVMQLVLQLGGGPVSSKIPLSLTAKYCSHWLQNTAPIDCKILLPLSANTAPRL